MKTTMPGRVVDLSLPGATFPDPIVVDTNLVVELLLVSFLGTLPRPATINANRAAQFSQDLAAKHGTGIVTPTVFTEFVHIAIRNKYKYEFAQLRSSGRQPYGRPVQDWLDLYKLDGSILQAFGPDLERLRQLLVANRLLFPGPDKLGPVASGRTYDAELVHLIGAYGLDSNDALILMEAQRLGVTDVVTLDADLQRAQADFTIYTWL